MPLQLRSLVRPDATLELSLVEVPMPTITASDEVLVHMEASPLNPSDMGLLLAGADMTRASQSGSVERPVITAPLSAGAMAAGTARVGTAMPVGNEGAGTVIAAGDAAEAQALLGKRVALYGGAMYAEYRAVSVKQCLPLPAGATATQGASSFINPLTALGMVETMRTEGHRALVHTVGASNLGQMLNRICLKDGVPLVNIVRKPEHATLLREQGALQVVDSSVPDFTANLVDAIAATGATLAFDAIGGGRLAGQILAAMEAALLRQPGHVYSRYGTDIHKQVYLYGGLNPAPVEIERSFGMAWGVGGWLVFPFLQRLGPQRTQQLQQRVSDELTSTFASHYTKEISLQQVLTLEAIKSCSRMATGEKTLIRIAPG
ncbi:zinc-binding dehydrogenase [Bordetella tumulicola]|uniref:zinc-binding dehydrogenase n=1 Tax=Bordetella tumulicola TaxID=1649133 RepID=UPI0039EFD2FD